MPARVQPRPPPPPPPLLPPPPPPSPPPVRVPPVVPLGVPANMLVGAVPALPPASARCPGFFWPCCSMRLPPVQLVAPSEPAAGIACDARRVMSSWRQLSRTWLRVMLESICGIETQSMRSSTMQHSSRKRSSSEIATGHEYSHTLLDPEPPPVIHHRQNGNLSTCVRSPVGRTNRPSGAFVTLTQRCARFAAFAESSDFLRIARARARLILNHAMT